MRTILIATAFAMLAAVAKAAPAIEHTGPCEHSASRVAVGNADPVEQSCALAMAAQMIGEQAQTIVALRAHLAVARSDLAAATAEKPAPASPAAPGPSAK